MGSSKAQAKLTVSYFTNHLSRLLAMKDATGTHARTTSHSVNITGMNQQEKSHPGGEVDGEWNIFSCLLSRIPYYCVITQYGLTKIFGGDRLEVFLAVYYHILLITVLLHNTV